MKFINEEHESFFNEKLKQYKRTGGSIDCYCLPTFYLLGLCADTRSQFSTLFDMKDQSVRIEGLHASWQTGTSLKICRLAFNLWNGHCYEQGQSLGEENKVSDCFAIDNIFCCSYAEYFFEAIRLRYPEYCKIA